MGKTIRIIITRWGPAVMWMIVIFFLSNRQSVAVSPQYILNFLFFKLLHVLEYAVLFTLLLRATTSRIRAFVVTVLYALTDEVHQQFVPTREGRLRDVIIDAIGVGFVWWYLVKLLPKAPKRLKSWAKKWGILNPA